MNLEKRTNNKKKNADLDFKDAMLEKSAEIKTLINKLKFN